MDLQILKKFQDTVLSHPFQLYGISILKRDGESLNLRFRSDDRENIYSGSKTFIALAIGMCSDEGLLSLHDPVLRFFPEYEEISSPGSEAITLRDMLHMADGKTPPAWYNRPQREHIIQDIAWKYFQEPQAYAPGTHFQYSSLCTYMLGRVVERVCGCTPLSYLRPRLFAPMGIHNPQWMTCPHGHTMGSTGLYLRTEEYARLGMLLLQGGEYNERRIVSEAYVQAMMADTIEPPRQPGHDEELHAGYGYQLWKCTRPGVYRADGMYGQYCVLFPEHGAVVATTGHQERQTYDVLRAIYRDIVEEGVLG